MKPKLKDVAAAAGVSLATASLVLSGKGRISEVARQKVLKAVEALGYVRRDRPVNSLATGTLGILHSIDYEWGFIWVFIRPLVEEIEQNMRAMGISTVLIPIKKSEPTQEIVEKVRKADVRAVVALHYGNSDLFTTLEESDIPVVVVMNGNFQDSFYSVCVDDYQGAYEGTLHLIKLGHRDIAYVEAERPDLPMLLNDRFIGYRKAMEEYALRMPEETVIRFELSDRAELEGKIAAAFKRANRPTAVFCLDDEIALRVYYVLQELGFRIPEDVSLLAPGDVLDYQQHYYPQITTMRINTTYMGKIVSQMIQNRINHRPEDIHVLKVKQQLVRRGSCRELKTAARSRS
ncbi:MAG: LacI family DNA-binding transcriptional regulator [Spirochaetales bacterium]|nr:LacI family DNA-binding transcriptional regulator [Spirochaetales bacterium]